MNKLEKNKLAVKAQNGCDKSKLILIEEMQGFVVQSIKRYGMGLNRDDLESEGYIAILEAINNYDDNVQNASFQGLVFYTIMDRIQVYSRANLGITTFGNSKKEKFARNKLRRFMKQCEKDGLTEGEAYNAASVYFQLKQTEISTILNYGHKQIEVWHHVDDSDASSSLEDNQRRKILSGLYNFLNEEEREILIKISEGASELEISRSMELYNEEITDQGNRYRYKRYYQFYLKPKIMDYLSVCGIEKMEDIL